MPFGKVFGGVGGAMGNVAGNVRNGVNSFGANVQGAYQNARQNPQPCYNPSYNNGGFSSNMYGARPVAIPYPLLGASAAGFPNPSAIPAAYPYGSNAQMPMTAPALSLNELAAMPQSQPAPNGPSLSYPSAPYSNAMRPLVSPTVMPIPLNPTAIQQANGFPQQPQSMMPNPQNTAQPQQQIAPAGQLKPEWVAQHVSEHGPPADYRGYGKPSGSDAPQYQTDAVQSSRNTFIEPLPHPAIATNPPTVAAPNQTKGAGALSADPIFDYPSFSGQLATPGDFAPL